MFTEEELKNEVWRPISGYEGLYEVSNLGRVKSLPRMRKGRGVGLHRTGGRILSCNGLAGEGYPIVQLSNVSLRQFFVHRLVADTFIPKIHGKEYINHKDGDKTNNRVDNLEWCTFSENMNHAWKTGLRKDGTHPNKKRVRVFYQNGDIKEYDSIADASRETGVDQSNISRLCGGNRKMIKGIKAEFII